MGYNPTDSVLAQLVKLILSGGEFGDCEFLGDRFDRTTGTITFSVRAPSGEVHVLTVNSDAAQTEQELVDAVYEALEDSLPAVD